MGVNVAAHTRHVFLGSDPPGGHLSVCIIRSQIAPLPISKWIDDPGWNLRLSCARNVMFCILWL